MGGRKKSEGGGRGANLTSNAARQGMKMQESGFPHFFVTTKGLVSNPENEISTKNESEQLRQRCSPTLWEKTMKEGGWREEDGRGRAKKNEWDGDGEGEGMQEDS